VTPHLEEGIVPIHDSEVDIMSFDEQQQRDPLADGLSADIRSALDPFPPIPEVPPFQPETWPLADHPAPRLEDVTATEVFATSFERRVVHLTGRLDSFTAGQVVALLISLDAESARSVQLVINSPGGPALDVLPVIDAIEMMQSPVDCLCIGEAVGTAALVLASGSGLRRCSPNARISLRLSSQESFTGSVTELESFAAEARQAIDQIQRAFVRVTHMPEATVAIELDSGVLIDAARAVELGIVDAVARPHDHQLDRVVGYQRR
jgi:ATP-dependent Clp protease, protease subunit